MSKVSKYYDSDRIAKAVRDGKHRLAIGDMWDEIGGLQISFMREQGLEPQDSLLDIGCGSLRGGVRFIEYLDPGNYFGIDANQSLIDAGYDIELSDSGLQEKLPITNLLCDRDFKFERFGRSFDFALALSVFTHLPLNHVRVCLEKLSPYMAEGGRFFATYFEIPDSQPTFEPRLQQPGGLTTYATREPYHYRFSDFTWLAGTQGWRVERVADFPHPRNQKMLRFDPDP
ncbi:MAG TPA: class I SAM-dependent methyltransferase [Solirubrobacterales bacterium]|nr:class I SAM-dependent methyltransferase [Solirubrobacterales bacterium]